MLLCHYHQNLLFLRLTYNATEHLEFWVHSVFPPAWVQGWFCPGPLHLFAPTTTLSPLGCSRSGGGGGFTGTSTDIIDVEHTAGD